MTQGRADSGPAVWLLRCDRQVWPWLAPRLGRAGEGAVAPPVSEEVGEGWRLVTLSGGEGRIDGMVTPFLWWRQPVALDLEWRDNQAGRFPEVLAMAAGRAVADGAGAAMVFAIRRYGGHGVAAVEPLLRQAGLAIVRPDSTVAADTRSVLSVAVSDRRLYAGIAAGRDFGRPWPGGSAPAAGGLPSRAGAKLRQLFEILEWKGVRVERGGDWLELGAYPGGMTAVLAERARRVTAVDLRDGSLEAALPAPANVDWLVADVEGYRHSGPPVDGLVCDVNGPATVTARTVARLAVSAVRPGGLIVMTIKIRDWAEAIAEVAAVRTLLSGSGLTETGVWHVPANRQEVMMVARTA